MKIKRTDWLLADMCPKAAKCLRSCVRKQPIIALYFESETGSNHSIPEGPVLEKLILKTKMTKPTRVRVCLVRIQLSLIISLVWSDSSL